MADIPDGFVRHAAKRSGPAHVNNLGFVHGGLLTALADNAMGLTCASRIADIASPVTISMSIDFIVAARQGQWITFETRFAKVGSTICLADCFVMADGVPCARASGTFRALRNQP